MGEYGKSTQPICHIGQYGISEKGITEAVRRRSDCIVSVGKFDLEEMVSFPAQLSALFCPKL
jgi:hypothetical protein